MTKQFKEYIDTCHGAKCWIYGLGPTATIPPPTGVTVFGVNDFIKFGHTKPDFLVCIDSLQSFSPVRQKIIKDTKCPVFTQYVGQLQIPQQKIMISLAKERGVINLNPSLLDVSFSSVFVALQIAYHMSFTDITIAGNDISQATDHHLIKKYQPLLDHFTAIRLKMLESRTGLTIKSASNPEGVLRNWPHV
jgi:hypothetical protein